MAGSLMYVCMQSKCFGSWMPQGHCELYLQHQSITFNTKVFEIGYDIRNNENIIVNWGLIMPPISDEELYQSGPCQVAMMITDSQWPKSDIAQPCSKTRLALENAAELLSYCSASPQQRAQTEIKVA